MKLDPALWASSNRVRVAFALRSLNALSDHDRCSSGVPSARMQNLNQVADEGCAVAPVSCHHIFEGLVPIAWLEAAAKLPGKSMHLAIALLCIAIVEQTRTVRLSNLACERFGLNRNSKYRALRSLENAALVTAERKPGRSPIVMIQCDNDAT